MSEHNRLLGRQRSIIPLTVPTFIRATASLEDKALVPPDDINWSDSIDLSSMLLNNIYGCCTVAGVSHLRAVIERWVEGVARQPSDADIVPNYKLVNPQFDPTKPETDVGATILGVMMNWYKTGFNYLGSIDKIMGFAAVDPTNVLDLRKALWLGGPLIVGAQLPVAAQKAGRWVTPPDLNGVNAKSSWGDHCMVVVRWVAGSHVVFSTWGSLQEAEEGWFTNYIDEVYMPIHPLWISEADTPAGMVSDSIIKQTQTFSQEMVN